MINLESSLASPVWVAGVWLLVSLLASPPAAALMTGEQMTAYKENRGRPGWRQDIERMKQLRASPPSEYAKMWQELDGTVDLVSGKNAITRLTNPKSVSEYHGYTAWLRDAVLQNKLDGRYSYAYALNLLAVDTKGTYLKEAAIFLAHARLSLEIDGARCARKELLNTVVEGYESQPTIRRLEQATKLMPPRQQADAKLSAVVLEEVLGERLPNQWLCKGMAPTLVEVPTPAGDIGKTMVFGQKADGEPSYIEESAWKQIRQQKLDVLTKALQEEL